jgi:putative hemolysin
VTIVKHIAIKKMISVRLAQNEQEIIAAQKVRYSVFYEEQGAIATPEIASERRDYNHYDQYADHLIVIDHDLSDQDHNAVVGTYRLLIKDRADQAGGFYTKGEFDISPLVSHTNRLLELGRSCVLPEYRSRLIMQKLWEGIAHYIALHEIEIMFGCASFPTLDLDSIRPHLSYLYHNHLAPPHIRPRTLDPYYIALDEYPIDSVDLKRTFASLPPLLKGYLRVGGVIGDGAFIDHDFHTIDVCIVTSNHLIKQSYLSHYQRKVDMPILNETQKQKRQEEYSQTHNAAERSEIDAQ